MGPSADRPVGCICGLGRTFGDLLYKNVDHSRASSCFAKLASRACSVAKATETPFSARTFFAFIQIELLRAASRNSWPSQVRRNGYASINRSGVVLLTIRSQLKKPASHIKWI